MKEKLTVCGFTRKNTASADQHGEWTWVRVLEKAVKNRSTKTATEWQQAAWWKTSKPRNA
jgi:hypothetical protein